MAAPIRQHLDHRAWPQPLQKRQKMTPLKGDAALGWQIAGPRHVHEDGAAASAQTRSLVVPEHHQHIVELILPPQPLGAGRVGVADRAIVVAITRGIAPSVQSAHGLHRQRCARPGQTVGAETNPNHRPAPDRGGAIALPLVHPAAAATKCAGKGQRTQIQSPPACGRRQCDNGDGHPVLVLRVSATTFHKPQPSAGVSTLFPFQFWC